MDWKQIETNWAVMARRIRADVHCGIIDDGQVLHHRTGKGETTEIVVAQQVVAVSIEITQKHNPVSTR
jgi:hypothetical protein